MKPEREDDAFLDKVVPRLEPQDALVRRTVAGAQNRAARRSVRTAWLPVFASLWVGVAAGVMVMGQMRPLGVVPPVVVQERVAVVAQEDDAMDDDDTLELSIPGAMDVGVDDLDADAVDGASAELKDWTEGA